MSRKMLISFFLLVLAGTFGFFYTVPEWKKFKRLNKDMENLTNLSIEIDALLQKRDELVNAANSFSKKDREAIQRALPVDAQAANFLVSIERIALKNKITLKSIEIAARGILAASPAIPSKTGAESVPRPAGKPTTPAAPVINELPIVLTGEGEYEAFKAFLQDLERSQRLVDIKNISLSATKILGPYPFTFQINTYYQ